MYHIVIYIGISPVVTTYRVVTTEKIADVYEYQKGKSPPFRDGSVPPEKNLDRSL